MPAWAILLVAAGGCALVALVAGFVGGEVFVGARVRAQIERKFALPEPSRGLFRFLVTAMVTAAMMLVIAAIIVAQ